MNQTTPARFLTLPTGHRLLWTIFWVLWAITVTFVVYGLTAEVFGWSFLYLRYPYPVLEAITSSAGLGLAVATAAIWRSAPQLHKFGIIGCLMEVFNFTMPRF